MTQCIGYWKSQKADENFDAYLKEIGIGFAQRQLGKLVTSYEEITQDGDTWTISIQASVKHGSVTFKLGEEVEETTPDGRKVRSRFEIEDDKLVKYQTSSDGKHSVKMTRERLDENTLVMDVAWSGANLRPRNNPCSFSVDGICFDENTCEGNDVRVSRPPKRKQEEPT